MELHLKLEELYLDVKAVSVLTATKTNNWKTKKYVVEPGPFEKSEKAKTVL